mgnify:FL=1
MEDNVKSDPECREGGQGSGQLLFVLLVVLIICGGNGVGILAAGGIWKLTQQMAAASVAAVIITVLAFAVGMTLVVLHNKRRR